MPINSKNKSQKIVRKKLFVYGFYDGFCFLSFLGIQKMKKKFDFDQKKFFFYFCSNLDSLMKNYTIFSHFGQNRPHYGLWSGAPYQTTIAMPRGTLQHIEGPLSRSFKKKSPPNTHPFDFYRSFS